MPSYFEELTANARQKLIESSNELTGYTKNINPSQFIWAPKRPCGNQVVSIEATARAEQAAAERLQDPTMPAAEADTLEPFIFSMIVSITSEDFFALPCGRWMRPTEVAPTFADAKLTFTGAVPADPRLARDFRQSCAKIVQLFELVRPSGTNERRGVLLKQDVSRIKLRFTHRLFQKVEEGEEEDDDIPPAFTIHQWPVRHQKAREAIAGMTTTHRVNYLPAYNAIGNLIYPNDYEAQLRGALAQVKFTLSHWNICQKDSHNDVFSANIEHIRILTPPYPASPSKRRKFSATDNVSGDISPLRLPTDLVLE